MRALGHEQISSSMLGSTNDVENMIQYDRIIHMLLEARAKSFSTGGGGKSAKYSHHRRHLTVPPPPPHGGSANLSEAIQ